MNRANLEVPFNRPDVDEADIARVVATLRSGWITTGPVVREFETALKRYLAVPRVVCLNSATAGMELVLRALGIGPGDEVITTVYTYAATANVVRHSGARLVLVDTAPGSFLIDPQAVAAALTPRTKALMPVDFAGLPADCTHLRAAADACRADFVPSNAFQEATGRPVILLDAAHAFGSLYAGERVARDADFSVYSFHAVKNLTTAEGGAVAWRGLTGEGSEVELEAEFERRLRLLALHGQSKDALAKMSAGSWEYDIEISGYKHNMTDMQAALAIGQLERYAAQLARRREICRRYEEGLPEPVFVHPFVGVGEDLPSFHIYPLRLRGFDETRRNALIASLAARGIAANVHFKPLPLFTAFRDEFDIKNYPNAWETYSSEVTLPLYPALTNEQVEHVIGSLRTIVGLA